VIFHVSSFSYSHKKPFQETLFPAGSFAVFRAAYFWLGDENNRFFEAFVPCTKPNDVIPEHRNYNISSGV
jgi:hypothetical protein